MADLADVAPSETPEQTETTAPTTTAPPVAPASASEGQEPDDEDVFDKDRAMATIKKLREEAKRATAAIKELETFRAERKAAQDAQLSEQERLTKRQTELEAELAQERTDKQERTNRYEVQLAANRLGIVDPDAAVKLLDWQALEIGTDGRPVDIDKALKLLIKDRPYLAGDTQQAPRPSVGNPATRSIQPGQRLYSRAELNDYSFYSTHRDDITKAMREGRIVD